MTFVASNMVFMYSEFHGCGDEDIEDFLERFEVAIISNHIEDEAQVLRLLKLCLKDDARARWMSFEANEARANPPRFLILARVKQALMEQFKVVEDPSVVWQELSDLQQQKNEDVATFVRRFEDLWKRWCLALGEEQPPLMIKKNMFIDGLVTILKAKVDLKQPSNFEDAVLLAKEKEWKIVRQKELGSMVDESYLQMYVGEESYA